MRNFREELDRACLQAAQMHYLEEVENVFEKMLKMLKTSKPIEILSVREITICISKQNNPGLFHIQARCKTYEENECIINQDILDTNGSLEYLKLVVEFVLRSQKLKYDSKYKPIKYDNITPAEYPAYEITVQI